MFKWVYDRYVRSVSNAQCSPAAVVIGAIVALCVVGYIYRHIIELTLIWTVVAVTIAGLVAAAWQLGKVIHTWRVERAEAMGDIEDVTASTGDPWTAPVAEADTETIPSVEAGTGPIEIGDLGLEVHNPMAADADHLASENVELAFDEEGRLVEKVRGK